MNKAGSMVRLDGRKALHAPDGSPFATSRQKGLPTGEGFPGAQKHRGSAVRSALNPFHMDRLQPLVGAQSEVW
jgi:hypothetical protein